MNKTTTLLLSLLIITVSCAVTPQKQDLRAIVIGTSTSVSNLEEGIYTYYFDQNSAKSTSGSSLKIGNPTFMTFDNENNILYSISNSKDNIPGVHSYLYDSTQNSFNKIDYQPYENGAPCHIIKGNGWLATANYSSGNISAFAVNKKGDIKPIQQQINFNNSQPTPSHLHCLIYAPDKNYIFATDLGKDSIYRFKINSLEDINQGKDILKRINPAVAVKTGSGPRHLTFAPNQKQAYLINELSGTVTCFNYENNTLKEFQTIASDSVNGGRSADIHISSDNKFLYSSNRQKEDGISIFSINNSNGRLTKIGYINTGIHPRNFTLSPDEKYILVACRDSNAVQIYNRNKDTGMLKYMGEEYDIKVKSPMFVNFI